MPKAKLTINQTKRAMERAEDTEVGSWYWLFPDTPERVLVMRLYQLQDAPIRFACLRGDTYSPGNDAYLLLAGQVHVTVEKDW